MDCWQVVAVTDLGLGTSENAGAMASGGVTTALTLADGVLVDLSIVGMVCSMFACSHCVFRWLCLIPLHAKGLCCYTLFVLLDMNSVPDSAGGIPASRACLDLL